MFYLDGAHSPESMEVCANWFSLAVKEDNRQQSCSSNQENGNFRTSSEVVPLNPGKTSAKDSAQVRNNSNMHLFDNILTLRIH